MLEKPVDPPDPAAPAAAPAPPAPSAAAPVATPASTPAAALPPETTATPAAAPPPPPLDYAPSPEPWWRRMQRWLWTRQPRFTVGTLHYTGFGLIMLFVWLLWGDFCFTLLEEHLPNILPLKLNQLGAGDTTNALLNKTFGYTIVFLLAPTVSFRSDRTRTRWGRRIPYLLWSTPVMGVLLMLIGCYEPLTRAITGGGAQVAVLGWTLSSAQVSIIVLGALMVGTDIAGIFVNTIWYYLFNDVVPPLYISRFYALFRIVATLTGMAYNKWIFPHTLVYFQTIFVIAGVLYIVGFALMCLFVREGQYPPPPPNVDGRHGALSSIKTFAVECFTHRLYWWFFLANALFFASKLASMFIIIRNTKSLGMTMQQIGDFQAWVLGCALLLHFPAGWISDRFHPMRVYVAARIWEMLGTIATCVWIFHDFGPRGNLAYLYFTGLTFLPLRLTAEAAEMPMYMKLLPKDRFGQFCSANGMVRAFVLIFASLGAGMFIGAMEPWWGDRRYTWVAGWQLAFQMIAAVFLILLYRQWKLHGGLYHYVPPGVTLTPQTAPEAVKTLP